MLLKLCTQLKAVIFKTPKDCTWACLQDWASCMLEKVCRSILELPCVSALWVQTPPSTPTRLISIHLCCEHNVDSDFMSIDQEPKAHWVKALGACPGAGATLCKQQDSSLQALCASQGLWKQKAKDGQRELKDLKEVKYSEMTTVIQECYHVLSCVLSFFVKSVCRFCRFRWKLAKVTSDTRIHQGALGLATGFARSGQLHT